MKNKMLVQENILLCILTLACSARFWHFLNYPIVGQSIYGQNTNYPDNTPSNTDKGDGNTTDNITRPMWKQHPIKTAMEPSITTIK